MHQCQKELLPWVKKIKKHISDVEDVEETHTIYTKKHVLPVDLENPKNLEDIVGKIKNQLPDKEYFKN